jgi:cobalt-zinc-cadmium efflux system protein
MARRDSGEVEVGIARAAPPESHASEHLDSVLSGRLRQALLLTGIILAVELVGGIWSGSLALMADAGHVTTDVLALGLAWYAVEQTKRPADDVRTFGYHRAGILAASANGVTLIVLVFAIAYEAVQRFAHPQPVQGGIVIVSALVGVAVNGYIAFNFRGQGRNLNVRAAVLHAVGDMIASIGVILAGAIILFTGWTFIDPIVSVFIAALIGWNAFRIVLETVNILLEGTPRDLDLGAVRTAITNVDGVLSAHDLHVWCISSEHTAMSCHILVGEQPLAEAEGVMRAVEGAVCERFGIGHTTVQLEFREPCSEEADHLSEHNHPHRKLARFALSERRRTPLSRHLRQPARTAAIK